MLVVWIAGSGPYEAALKTDNELKELIDDYLKEQLEGQFEVGKISKIYRHDWVDDEFALGSYSYLSPHDNDDIRVIGEPILKGERLVEVFKFQRLSEFTAHWFASLESTLTRRCIRPQWELLGADFEKRSGFICTTQRRRQRITEIYSRITYMLMKS